MDRRWQLALDCLDCEQAPFGKGTLVRFRAALIACEGDRRLVERTVVLVEKKGGFNSRSQSSTGFKSLVGGSKS